MFKFYGACAVALLVGGCPHHGAIRLTYVPAAPAPASTATASGGTLVIEEPAPPPPPQPTVVPVPVNPAPAERAPRRPRAEAPPPEKPAEVNPTPAPPLQPLADAQRQASLRDEAARLQETLPQRINNLLGDLKPADREALEDARSFLAQSVRALRDGEAQRALALAHKASLLVDALEQRR